MIDLIELDFNLFSSIIDIEISSNRFSYKSVFVGVLIGISNKGSLST
jgi:hypothetical protein